MPVMRRYALLVFCLLFLAACGGGDPSPVSEQATAAVSQELVDAVRQAPDDPLARRALALALHEAGFTQDSLTHFERLVENDPSAEHLMDLARCYATLSRMPEAEKTYQRVLETSPRDPTALYDLGNLALAGGDSAAAIEYYGRAIQSDPKHLLAVHNLGAALQRAQRFTDAYRSFEKVLEFEPKNAEEIMAFDDALYSLAKLDLQMGATERSVKFLEVLLESVPEHGEAHLTHGKALSHLGRTEEAEKAFATHRQLAEQRARQGAAGAGSTP